jgi:Protein of unknown function (DUF1194).
MRRVTGARRGRGIPGLVAGLAAALTLAATPAQACRLALVLGMDISSSVNPREYAIQLGGLAAALEDPEVVEAMLSQSGTVWITAFEWSGWQQQDVILPWREMRGPEDAAAAAAVLRAHRRSYDAFSTAIGRAAQFAQSLFGRLPVPCDRFTIDLSGDGVNNEDLSVGELRARGGLRGVTVNGLVIAGAWPDPAAHYAEEVIGGPGAS